VVQDLHLKGVYTTGDQRTESVTYVKGQRQRFEFGDMVVLQQPDLQRTVQISKAANTYLVVPQNAPAVAPPAVLASTPAAKPGVVTLTVTVIDSGERKSAFGLQARHVKTVVDKQPMPGACDTTRQRIETDGWYVDVPAAPTADASPVAAPAPSAGACADTINVASTGDAKALGFPIAYSTTITGEDGKPSVVKMEVTELEITTLDASLFDVPAGMKEATDVRILSQAVSDANETTLARQLQEPPTVPKAAGTILVGVADVVNKTTQAVDTRALRSKLVADLVTAQIAAAPLAGSDPALAQLAGAHGYDYVLRVEITDMKVSKGGGIGGVLKAASKATGAVPGGPEQIPTEAALSFSLVQPDGKARLTKTAKGSDGGFDMKAGLGMAKFAGTMYMNVMTGKLMMNALTASSTGNLGGLGMLGNPAMANIQARTMPRTAGMLAGIDTTASAASFIMQQAMTSSVVTGPGRGGENAPSFDAALADALQDTAHAVADSIKKGTGKK